MSKKFADQEFEKTTQAVVRRVVEKLEKQAVAFRIQGFPEESWSNLMAAAGCLRAAYLGEEDYFFQGGKRAGPQVQ